MADAGVNIAAGTDAGNPGVMHASSLFAELMAMKQSGMSNWQIIRSATVGGAMAIGKENEFGSIIKGQKGRHDIIECKSCLRAFQILRK